MLFVPNFVGDLTPQGYYMIFAHVMGLQGLFFALTSQVPFKHVLFALVLAILAGLGVVSGTHRLWTHRSYKAKLPLRIMLMLMHTLSGHLSVIRWSIDHRLHHKYAETDADPYNIRRGVFFSHIGWFVTRKHPEVTEKEKTMDFSDLYQDPVIAFQYKYHWFMELLVCQILPVFMAHYLCHTPLYICWCYNLFRYVLSFHIASLGNSIAHTWLRKPYEKSFSSSDVTWLSPIIFGEGWHNYHHVFPWDYRSTDQGQYYFNPGAAFIDMMAWIGWAYDLKTVPSHVIRKRAARTGDGSWNSAHNFDGTIEPKDGDDLGKGDLDFGEIGPAPWGWGDADIPIEDRQDTVIIASGDSAEEKKL